jgi:hypothetical protein
MSWEDDDVLGGGCPGRMMMSWEDDDVLGGG